ncbi:hypothetical protein CCACVL1_23127 [Corchorus capsularis]|uniref:Uncharacterized protein n=1 Tax=Corchorus capsularis TaxID=210143 RepID=A0A1R3GV03_COCAP|nr:hypothetical protein CCACVL1_23127 [Corchorus capsularis]
MMKQREQTKQASEKYKSFFCSAYRLTMASSLSRVAAVRICVFWVWFGPKAEKPEKEEEASWCYTAIYSNSPTPTPTSTQT